MPRRALLVYTLLWTLLSGAMAGCSAWRADSRIEYWQAETRAHVTVASRIEDAQAFFAARGLDLHCCMSGPEIDHAYSATERNIGRLGWTAIRLPLLALWMRFIRQALRRHGHDD
jgi:hypothetical protein